MSKQEIKKLSLSFLEVTNLYADKIKDHLNKLYPDLDMINNIDPTENWAYDFLGVNNEKDIENTFARIEDVLVEFRQEPISDDSIKINEMKEYIRHLESKIEKLSQG